MIKPLIGILGSIIIDQAVKDIAEGFSVSALSKDWVIEAIEKDGEDFIVGIQWHPEMMTAAGDESMLKVFKKLVEESR